MIQIVHDMAPGAAIAFADSSGGEEAFANNIRALSGAGAKVIVDDVTLFAEPFFQDGPISVAVNEFTAAGRTFLSSAANSNVIVERQERRLLRGAEPSGRRWRCIRRPMRGRLHGLRPRRRLPTTASASRCSPAASSRTCSGRSLAERGHHRPRLLSWSTWTGRAGRRRARTTTLTTQMPFELMTRRERDRRPGTTASSSTSSPGRQPAAQVHPLPGDRRFRRSSTRPRPAPTSSGRRSSATTGRRTRSAPRRFPTTTAAPSRTTPPTGRSRSRTLR